MGHRVQLGEITNPILNLNPTSGLIDWRVTGIPGVDAARVELRDPGTTTWKNYATCGIGPGGTCGYKQSESWFTPRSTLAFRIVALNQAKPSYLREVLRRDVQAGAPAPSPMPVVPPPAPPPPPVVTSVRGAPIPNGVPAVVPSGGDFLWESTLIEGVPNAYLLGGSVVVLLLAARKRRR